LIKIREHLFLEIVFKVDLEIREVGLLVEIQRHCGFGVFAGARFKEVGLAFQSSKLHELERVGSLVNLGVPEHRKDAVGDEVDVFPS